LTIPGCCSRYSLHAQISCASQGLTAPKLIIIFSPFLETKRKERKKLYLPRVKYTITGNPVVYIVALKTFKESKKTYTIELFGQVEPTALKYNKL